jgi:2-amino-4-hydroxy-6-hydroxymethyldihydropteridine diphosphokinase
MNKVVMLAGSNEGNREENLAVAFRRIHRETGHIISASSIYETDPWGNTDQPSFLNQVIVVETDLDAGSVLQSLLSIEKEMGRVRKIKWEQRLIDLDILFFNDEIIHRPGLSIPHAHLHERRFVLKPLNELMPHYVHPVLNKTIEQLLGELKDQSGARIFRKINLGEADFRGANDAHGQKA